jgi:hypothetical protein
VQCFDNGQCALRQWTMGNASKMKMGDTSACCVCVCVYAHALSTRPRPRPQTRGLFLECKYRAITCTQLRGLSAAQQTQQAAWAAVYMRLCFLVTCYVRSRSLLITHHVLIIVNCDILLARLSSLFSAAHARELVMYTYTRNLHVWSWQHAAFRTTKSRQRHLHL